MNQELKKRWIEALRSGEYEQTSDCLRDEQQFCCLGVLCDVYDPTLWSGNRYRLIDKLGLNDTSAGDLINMNDGLGQNKKSFSEIADWIEGNL